MQACNRKIDRSSDSLFTKLLARSVSGRITPLLAKSSITPLQVTMIGLIVGLCAAWAGSKSEWAYGLLAAFLMESSHIMDCIDGELARMTGRGNPFAASLDPISDRIKDMAVIYAAYLQSCHARILNLSIHQISTIAFFAIAFWIFYMYVVDAFLNPSRKKRTPESSLSGRRIYLGLYDLFVYGSILFWLFNIFEFFMVYVLGMAIAGGFIQIFRLRRVL